MEKYNELITQFQELSKYYKNIGFDIIAKNFQDAYEAIQDLTNQINNIEKKGK